MPQSVRRRTAVPAGSATGLATDRPRRGPPAILRSSRGAVRHSRRRDPPLPNRMRISRVSAGRFAWLASVLSAWMQTGPIVRPLEYARSVLPNGLVVILNEDHASPIVAVDVWYHIGAKDESRGRTGLAHLCEHLMGEGSPNLSMPQRVFVQSLGGTSSRWANTTEDITHYYYTLPSHQLEVALWMESDRMLAPLSRADA